MTSASSFLNTSNSALQTSYYVTDHAPLSATSVSFHTVNADTNPQTRDLLQLNSRLDDILARTRSQSSLGVRVSPPKVTTTSETYLRSSPGVSGLRYSGIETNLRKSNAEIKAILRTDSPTLRRSLIDGTKTKTVTFASPADQTSSLSKSYSTSYITNGYTLPASYTEKPVYTYLNTSYTAAPTVKTSSPSRADYKYTLYEPLTYTATRVSDPLSYTSTKVESPGYKTSTYTATKIESPSYTKVVEPTSYVATKVVEPPSYYTTTVREPTYTTATVLEPYTYTTTRVVEPSTYTTTKFDSPKRTTSLTDLSLSYKPVTTTYESTLKKASSPTYSPKRYTIETTKTSSSPSKLQYDKDRLDQLISRIQTTRATYSPLRTSAYSPSKTTSYVATSSYVPASTSQYQFTTAAPVVTSTIPASASSSYLYSSSTPYYTSTSVAAPYVSTSTIRSAPYVDTERVKSTGVNRYNEYQSQGYSSQTHLGKLENDVESLTFDDATGEPIRHRNTTKTH